MDKADIYAALNEAYFSDDPHEREVIDHLPLLLGGVRVGVDCGASLGQYTRTMARALHGGAVHAVEADPVRFEELSRNGERWERETGNVVTAHNYAVSDTVGEVPFFVTNSNISGGLAKHDVDPGVEWEEITIPTITLDALFPEEPPGFVKIDVEGAELAVLHGASRVLAQGQTTFLIELHGWDESNSIDVIGLMAAHGYHLVDFFGQAVFTKDRVLWRRLIALELSDPGRAKRRAKTMVKKLVGPAKKRVGRR